MSSQQPPDCMELGLLSPCSSGCRGFICKWTCWEIISKMCASISPISLLITLRNTTVTMTTKAFGPPPSYFKSALCREEDVQFWRGQLGFHCIYKWADKKHVSHPQSASMMGWIWRMMTTPGLDTQVFKREQSGGQDAAPTLKYQCSLLPQGFTQTHMRPNPKGWLAHDKKRQNWFYGLHWRHDITHNS